MRRKGFHFVVFLAPILVAVLLSAVASRAQVGNVISFQERLEPVEVDSVSELKALFDDLQYTWPLAEGESVPTIAINSLPAGIGDIVDVEERKSLFFRAVLPIVLAGNEVIAELRRHILATLSSYAFLDNEPEQRWLQALADYYDVAGDLTREEVRQELLHRVDVIPAALVLAQAANESAWGTSRFALKGNNLFGHWTYRQSEGMVPLQRPKGEFYAVRKFPSVHASVWAYMHNLNTNKAYAEFRHLRAEMRDAGLPMDAHALAAGLTAYSSRGDAYIEEIRSMMQSNELLTLLDSVSLKQGAS